MQNGWRAVLLSGLAVLGGAATVCAQVDLDAAERELDTMFNRPEGTTISAEQKAKLAEFLARHAGQDLGRLGYAPALGHYFRRDVAAGAAALDAFFAAHDHINNAEHATMAGRIYMAAAMAEGRAEHPDMTSLCRWGERMAALYGDLGTLGRAAIGVIDRLADPAPFRVAIARGLARSRASDGEKDQLLATIYAPREKLPPPASDIVPSNRTLQPTSPAVDHNPTKAATSRDGSIDLAPLTVPVEAVVGGKEGFTLGGLQGKVVVIDLLASWCPPCRAGVAPLAALVSSYSGQVELVTLTRFYGRGMDFTDGAQPPHGGKTVDALDKQAEQRLYERFAKAFQIENPIVFTTLEAWQQQLGVTVVPSALVVGKDGKLLGRVAGSSDATRAQLKGLLDKALQTR